MEQWCLASRFVLYKEDELLLTTDGSWKYTFDTRFNTIDCTMGYDSQFLENIDMRVYYGLERLLWLRSITKSFVRFREKICQ